MEGSWLQGFAVLGNSSFSPEYTLLVGVLSMSLLFVLASLFIVIFYKVMSKRDFLKLDLKKYNNYQHPRLRKLAALILFLIEYVIILPFLVLLWFGAFSIILLFIIEGNDVRLALFVSAIIVIGTRFFSYFDREIAKEVAKLIPFVALATFLLSPSEISWSAFSDLLSNLPRLFSSILSYFLAIFIVEFVLRVLYSFRLWKTSEPD